VAKTGIHSVVRIEASGPEAAGAQHGLAQIAKVHGINDRLNPVRVRAEAARVSASDHGAYRIAGDDTAGIWLRPGDSSAALTTVHEMGHFIDHQAFGTHREFGSESGAMPRLMAAIQKGPASTKLKREVRLARGRRDKYAAHYRYLNKPEERFARAYSQYIATQSGDPVLRQQLDRDRQSRYGDLMYHSDEEFAPIAAEFDRHFSAQKLAREA
jgi:hypothetical protein